MRLSYVILTYNRKDDLLRTLAILRESTPLPPDQWEVIVVDNASTDGTAQAVARLCPWVRLIVRPSNEGSIGRNAGAAAAKGRYILLLDDDSYPLGDTVLRSVDYLDRHEQTALVGGRVNLPDGSQDAAAFPIIMPACAMCIRKAAFDQIGGFSREFFRQAEEYDLIFRLLRAGFDVQRFEDLLYRHEKVPRSRSHELIHRMDLRNNLILIEKFLHREYRRIYRGEWLRRYLAMSRHEGYVQVSQQAIAQARQWLMEEGRNQRQTLSAPLLERVFNWWDQAEAVGQWSNQHNVKQVVIADYSKNLYATWRACHLAGLKVLSIADGSAAFAGMSYRGLSILADEPALQAHPDGIVLSNVNPGRIERRLEELGSRFKGPILRLWKPQLCRI